MKNFWQKVYDFFTVKNSLITIIGLLLLILVFQNVHGWNKDSDNYKFPRPAATQMKIPGMMWWGGGDFPMRQNLR